MNVRILAAAPSHRVAAAPEVVIKLADLDPATPADGGSACGTTFPRKRIPMIGPPTGAPRMGSDLSHRSEEAFASTKLLRRRSWFVDDCMVSEPEDLFTHYAGQDEGQRLQVSP